MLDVVIPVLNEEAALADSVRRLDAFLAEELAEYDWSITIADNGSTDATPAICRNLSDQHPSVRVIRLEKRGRGRALKRAWEESDADVVAYMDVDLSTDLAALPQAVSSVAGGGWDIAIGSRLKKGAQVTGRSLLREFISRSYSLLFRCMFFAGFQDAQCGFKALNRRVKDDVVPLVADNGWFFDTELLLIAEKNGYKINEIPVRWTDDPDSRVRIIHTAYEDLNGLIRLRFGGLRRASRIISQHNSGRS